MTRVKRLKELKSKRETVLKVKRKIKEQKILSNVIVGVDLASPSGHS